MSLEKKKQERRIFFKYNMENFKESSMRRRKNIEQRETEFYWLVITLLSLESDKYSILCLDILIIVCVGRRRKRDIHFGCSAIIQIQIAIHCHQTATNRTEYLKIIINKFNQYMLGDCVIMDLRGREVKLVLFVIYLLLLVINKQTRNF